MDNLETVGREEERALLIAESDAVCECGTDPKADPEAHKVESGWFIDSTLAEDGTVLASMRCPRCW